MSDTLDTTAPARRLLVDGRDPFADEAIASDDGGSLITLDVLTQPGSVLVSGVSGANGVATITVTPGSEDTNRTSGSDTITVSTPVAPTPLSVTLE